MTPKSPVCLVTGVGDGTGASLVRRFAAGGYQVAMLARSAQRLDKLAREIPGTAAFPCDVGNLDALRSALEGCRARSNSRTRCRCRALVRC